MKVVYLNAGIFNWETIWTNAIWMFRWRLHRRKSGERIVAFFGWKTNEDAFILCWFVQRIFLSQFDHSFRIRAALAKLQWMESTIFLCLSASHVSPTSANLIGYIHTFSHLYIYRLFIYLFIGILQIVQLPCVWAGDRPPDSWGRLIYRLRISQKDPDLNRKKKKKNRLEKQAKNDLALIVRADHAIYGSIGGKDPAALVLTSHDNTYLLYFLAIALLCFKGLVRIHKGAYSGCDAFTVHRIELVAKYSAYSKKHYESCRSG